VLINRNNSFKTCSNFYRNTSQQTPIDRKYMRDHSEVETTRSLRAARNKTSQETKTSGMYGWILQVCSTLHHCGLRLSAAPHQRGSPENYRIDANIVWYGGTNCI
jgi:hypothetical protein